MGLQRQEERDALIVHLAIPECLLDEGLRLRGQNFETRIDSVVGIDRLHTRHLRAVRLLAVGEYFGKLVGVRLQLPLAATGYSLDKALDGWADAALGY